MSGKQAREKSHTSAGSKASTSGASAGPRSLQKSASTHDEPEQSKRFLEAANDAGADETVKGAERAFMAVVKPQKAHK